MSADFEPPRRREQREKRESLLAEIQWKNGWSSEEMADHFRKLAEAKSAGFDSIEEYEKFQSQQQTLNSPAGFNHWDQIAKGLRGKGVILSPDERVD